MKFSKGELELHRKYLEEWKEEYGKVWGKHLALSAIDEIDLLQNHVIEQNEEMKSLLTIEEMFNEFLEKTEWIQDEYTQKRYYFIEAGMHRADGIKKVVEYLEKEVETLEKDLEKANLKCEWVGKMDCGFAHTTYTAYYPPNDCYMALPVKEWQVEYYNYCPVCGRKIKYIEED